MKRGAIKTAVVLWVIAVIVAGAPVGPASAQSLYGEPANPDHPDHPDKEEASAEPLKVSLASERGWVSEDNGETKFMVSLSRPLQAGESVVVPLEVTDARVHRDWSIRFRKGDNGPGVKRSAVGPKSEVTFTEGGQTATLVLIGRPRSGTAKRLVKIAFGKGERAPHATGVDEGIRVANTRIRIKILDNDAGLSVVPASKRVVVAEGGSAEFTVRLATRPAGDVTVTATAAGPATADGPDTDVTASRSEVLAFTPANWNEAQTVTVYGQDDSADNPGGGRAATITLAASSPGRDGDTAYRGLATTVAVTVADDDPTTVALSGSDTSVEEASGTSEFTVTLGRALVAGETVAVPLVVAGVTAGDFLWSQKTGDGVNTGVTLTATNRLAPTVTLANAGARTAVLVFTATQDTVDEGASETATVTLGDVEGASETNVAGGAKPYDDGVEGNVDNRVRVTITDDDVSPGLVVSKQSLAVGEGVPGNSYTIALATEPTHDVTVLAVWNVRTVEIDGREVGSKSFYFTPATWDQPQKVTVAGVKDGKVNPGGRRLTSIAHVAGSDDPDYDGVVAPALVEVIVVDSEAISVFMSIAKNVKEGEDAVFRLRAVPKPAGPLAVKVRVSAAPAFGVAAATRTATIDTSGTTTLTVPTAGDTVDVPDGQITAAVLQSTGYILGSPSSTTITIKDDEPTTVTLARADATGGVQEGGTAELTVTLSRALSAGEKVAVPLAVSGVAAADFTLALKAGQNANTGVSLTRQTTLKPVVTLTGTGAQTATLEITATDDAIDEGDSETATITLGNLANESLATNVGGGTTASDDNDPDTVDNEVKITVADDDAAGLSVVPTLKRVAVAEGGATVGFTVELGSKPTAAVTVTVTSNTPTAAKVHAAGGTAGTTVDLTFQPAEWNTAKTVIVTGVDDDIDNPGNKRAATITLDPSSSTDTAYNALGDTTIAVTVADDDTDVDYHWPFDEGRGTRAANEGSSSVVGRLVGGAGWVQGRKGAAVSIPGQGHVQVGGGWLPASAGWTAAFWVKRTGNAPNDNGIRSALLSVADSGSPVNGRGSAVFLEYGGNRRMGFEVYNGTRFVEVEFNYSTPLDTWAHIALVGDVSGTKLYVNGASQDSENTAFDLPLHRIGARFNGNQPINAQVDDLIVKAKAMSAAEVKTLHDSYGAGAVNAEPGVVPRLRGWFGGVGTLSLSSNPRILVPADHITLHWSDDFFENILGGLVDPDKLTDSALIEAANFQVARSPFSTSVYNSSQRSLLQVAHKIASDIKTQTGRTAMVVIANPSVTPNIGDIILDIYEQADLGLSVDGYELETNDTNVTIKANSTNGIFYGSRTLLQMIRLATSNENVQLPIGRAVDWSDNDFRMVYVDAGRKYWEMGYLLDLLKQMSWMKMNSFMLHISEAEGFRLYSPDPAYVGLTVDEVAYSQAEIKRLDDFAKEHHITLIPGFDFPGHATVISDHFNIGLGDRRHDIGPHGEPCGASSRHEHTTANWTIDMTSTVAKERVHEILRRFIPWFSGPYVHLGADEVPATVGNCPRIAHYIDKTVNVRSGDVMLEFVNDMNVVVKEFNKIPMIFNGFEHLFPLTQHLTDRDTIVMPWEGKAVDYEGFQPYKMVNMNSEDGVYLTPNGTHNHWLDWAHLYTTSEIHSKRGAKQVGSAVGAWADSNYWATDEYFEHHFELGRAAIADRLWNSTRPTDTASDFKNRLDDIGQPPGFSGFPKRTRVNDGQPSLHYTFDEVTTWPTGYHNAKIPGWLGVLEEKIEGSHGSPTGWNGVLADDDAIVGESWVPNGRTKDYNRGIELGNPPIEPPWTMMVWAKREPQKGDAVLLSARDPLTGSYSYIYLKKGAHHLVTLRTLSGADHAFNYELPLHQWVHLAFVADGNSVKLYVNGTYRGSKQLSMPLPLQSIGTRKNIPHAYLDEMKIFDEVLSATQVKEQYLHHCSNSPVHHWRLNESGGLYAVDNGSAQSRGTVVGATWTSEGRDGAALSFDGTNDFISTSANTLSGDSHCGWTAALWVKRTGSQAESALFNPQAVSSEWRVKLEQWENTSKLGVSRRNVGDFEFNYIAPLYQWVHLALVGTRRGVTLYVDGVPKRLIPQKVDLPLYRIGDGIIGLLDDVRVYARPLSAAEIAALADLPDMRLGTQ